MAREIFRIREAIETDRHAVDTLLREADLVHAGVAPDYFLADPKRRGDEVIADVDSNPFESLWVAEDAAHKIVGLCHVQLYDTPRHLGVRQARRAHIETIVVAQKQRRTGCGKQLMQAAVAWSKDLKAEQILLTVWAGNADATAFYKSLGFNELNTVLGLKL